MNITFKSLVVVAALAVGGILGASAISALAQTGTWTAPTCTPPNCNTDAPLNVGTVTQEKNGALSLLGLAVTSSNFIFNPGGAGAPKVGDVLIAKDTTGTIGWADPYSYSDSCELLTTTPLAGSIYKSVDVPPLCINNSCTLVMAAIDSTGNAEIIRTASLISFADTSVTPKGKIVHWWAKSGGAYDGTDCNGGRNGTTNGCDAILKTGDNTILYDDNTSSGGESNNSQWTLRDTTSNYSLELYACK